MNCKLSVPLVWPSSGAPVVRALALAVPLVPVVSLRLNRAWGTEKNRELLTIVVCILCKWTI